MVGAGLAEDRGALEGDRSAESADAFSSALAEQKLVLARGTSISAAITFSAALLRVAPFDTVRKTIDISGDGPNNYGRPVQQARDEAVAEGIVINGLPIIIAPSPTVPSVSRYYAECVIGGPGSFMLPVRNRDEFKLAIRRKLILEIAGRRSDRIIPVAAEAPVDCLAGEKLRQRLADPYYPGLDN